MSEDQKWETEALRLRREVQTMKESLVTHIALNVALAVGLALLLGIMAGRAWGGW